MTTHSSVIGCAVVTSGVVFHVIKVKDTINIDIYIPSCNIKSDNHEYRVSFFANHVINKCFVEDHEFCVSPHLSLITYLMEYHIHIQFLMLPIAHLCVIDGASYLLKTAASSAAFCGKSLRQKMATQFLCQIVRHVEVLHCEDCGNQCGFSAATGACAAPAP